MSVKHKGRNSSNNLKSNKQDAKKKKSHAKKQDAEVKKVEEKKVKADPTNIYPDSLSIFNDLEPLHFYSRHYYAIRYVLKPTLFSASVTILYSVPWVTLILMFSGFVLDFVLGLKNVIFKKKLNNKSIVMENGIFILVSIIFAVFVANGEDKANAKMANLGYIVMALIGAAFISLVVFKVKGKKAL